MSVLHLDLELASELNLRDVGVDVWSRHPSTTPILVGFALDDDPVHSFDWNSEFVEPAELEMRNAVERGASIHAWNAAFERLIWNNVLTRKPNYGGLPLEQFHCTMAAAANAGLPMALDAAAQAVGSPHMKDASGHRNMLRMARPRAHEADGTPRWWHRESVPHLNALRLYNMADVAAEREIYRRIPRMSKREREIWLVDQRMNDRGLPVDKELLGAFGAITLNELIRLNKEIERVTHGQVESFSQHARLIAWLRHHGYPLTDLRKDTIAEFIGTPEFYDMDADGQKVLLLRAEAAKTSTAKLKSMSAFSQADGRARHLVQYGGAVRTLRWAGRGPQIQNYPRPLKSVEKHIKVVIREVLAGMPEDGLRLLFGNPLDLVSSCLRPVFQAVPGHLFVVCDYHAIEAIVLAWLAGFQALLDVFRRGEDVYIFTANQIGSDNRQLGKVLRLACGYGMGAGKFQDTAAGYKVILSALQSDEAVRGFRNTNKPIVSLWYSYERAARQAITYPDQGFHVGSVHFRMARRDGRVAGALLIEKPSGGTLVYRDAKLEDGRITYMGVHQLTRQWTKLDTYGGKLVENVTQSVARDLLADTMVLFDKMYPDALLTTVHDEIVAMAPEPQAPSVFAALKTLMSTPPAWASGMPLSAAGYVADRYFKA